MKRSAKGDPKASTPSLTAASSSASSVSSSDGDLAAPGDGEAAVSSSSSVSAPRPGPGQRQRQEAIKAAIESYFLQLTRGCGRAHCTNLHCRSSPNFAHTPGLTNNEAAAKAVELWVANGAVCLRAPLAAEETDSDLQLPSSQPPPPQQQPLVSSSCAPLADRRDIAEAMEEDDDEPPTPARATTVSSGGGAAYPTLMSCLNSTEYLSYSIMAKLVQECAPAQNWSPLIRIIGQVFSSVDAMLLSFLKDRSSPSADSGAAACHGQQCTTSLLESPTVPEKADLELSEKEQKLSIAHSCSPLGAVGGPACDLDAGASVSSSAPPAAQPQLFDECDWMLAAHEAAAALTLDVAAFQAAMNLLLPLSSDFYLSPLEIAVKSLCCSMYTDLRVRKIYDSEPNYVNLFVMLFDLLVRFDFENVLPQICHALSALPLEGQARLARVWSVVYRDSLLDLEKQLQQRITIRCLTVDWDFHKTLNSDEEIADCARVLKVVYAASLLAGEMDPGHILQSERESNKLFEEKMADIYRQAGYSDRQRNSVRQDPLLGLLNLIPSDCRRPLIPAEEFINETLNENLSVDRDYIAYKTEDLESISFMEYPFLLTTSTKNVQLYLDNRLRMLQERRAAGAALFQQMLITQPYLKLRVARDRVVEDALIALEITSIESPADLKKQLYVEFEGEAGVDEGGLSKEFFQLVVERLFNPDYGMFVYDDTTRCFWFNPAPVDDMEREYVLIGIVLGLAIYNHVILDIQFPPVLYRKLMGKLGRFADLEESHPTIYRSLKSILEFDPEKENGSLEDVLGCDFRISYPNMFGEVLSHDLIPGGDKVPVTESNRSKFVELYANFLLNESVNRQFAAFRRGFQMVVDESPLFTLFRPQELELLVCGSRVYNFSDLQRVTQYEGYTADSPVIQQFWAIIHKLPEALQRQLLQFTTGTDRVPLEGMGKLRFVIARQGPDSDRLPTAHTCFNVLLLPEYSNAEKLKERLLKAISYSKGFGMI